jgi:hypothetical protein
MPYCFCCCLIERKTPFKKTMLLSKFLNTTSSEVGKKENSLRVVLLRYGCLLRTMITGHGIQQPAVIKRSDKYLNYQLYLSWWMTLQPK